MTRESASARRLEPVILGLSAVLYLLYSRSYYVGYFNDDSFYVIGAKSLLRGRYALLSDPHEPPLTVFLPGVSLFFAPFVALAAPHWAALKGAAIAVALASCVVFRRLVRPWLSPGGSTIALALYALNPFLARAAGCVMSDGLFLFLTLSVFCLLRDVIEEERPQRAWLLGALLGWTMLVRPIGVVLAPATAAALLYARRWKAALRAFVPVVAIWGGFVWRNYRLVHSPIGYWSRWHESLDFVARLPRLADNVNRVSNLFFVVVPWGIRLPYSPLGIAASAVIVAVVLGLMGRGAWVVAGKGKKERALAAAMALFFLGYCGIHALWAGIDSRYALAPLPLILVFTTLGTRAALGPRLRNLSPVVLAVGLSTLVVWGNATNLRVIGRLAEAPNSRFPAATLAWIRANTPAQAVFLTTRPGEVYLYTGRRAVTHPAGPANDAEELRYWLLKEGISHVLDRPAQWISRPRSTGFPLDTERQRRDWLVARPRAFRPVYRNDSEGASVFEVIDDASFMKGYGLYLDARRELSRSDFDDCFRDLDAALALQPRLVSALTAYGSAALDSGTRLDAARSKLQRALDVDPGSFWAWLNLARLHRVKGRETQAREALERAAGAMAGFPNADEMRSALARAARRER